MAQATVFSNARLIDVVERRVRDGVSIVVEGERIARVADGRLLVPGATEIDLHGKTVMPGLIDTHVHTVMMDAESFPLFLAAGVTTARDVGGRLDLVLKNRADLNSGAKLGPRLFVCGPLLDGPGASFESPGFTIMLDRVDSVAAVPAKIGELLAAGVDGIKCYFTMTADIVREVIRFVGKRVPVTGTWATARPWMPSRPASTASNMCGSRPTTISARSTCALATMPR